MQQKFTKPVTLALTGIAILLCFLFLRYKWMERPDETQIKTIESDGMGYYLFLPSIFIYGDLQYAYLLNRREGPAYFESARQKLIKGENGRYFTRYYSGTAIMQLPFFLVAHTLSRLSDYPPDGFSIPYQLAIALAAGFYLLLGLWFSYQLCLWIGVSPYVSAMAVLLVATGTNLLNYAWKEPAFSHVYLFSAIAGLYYFWTRFLSQRREIFLFITVALAGLIFITRPTSVLALLALPFFMHQRPSIQLLKTILLRHQKGIVLGGLVGVMLVCLQLFLYYLQTGLISMVSYEGEQLFQFTRPAIYNFLVGFRKGWFVYTPLAALAFFGLRHQWLKERHRFYSVMVFYLIAVWVLSSWWNWWYGGSFGMRAMIDFYAITICLLALLLTSLQKWARLIVVLASIFFVFLNIAQNLQYFRNILYYDFMTEAKYSKIFLRGDKIMEWSTAPQYNPCATIDYNTIANQCIDFALLHDRPSVKKFQIGHPHESIGYHEILNKKQPYGALVNFKIESDNTVSRSISFFVSAIMPIPDMEAIAVISISKDEKTIYWYGEPLNRIFEEFGVPTTGDFCHTIPSELPEGSEINCYIMNLDSRFIKVLNLCVRHYEKK
jgi:hypothetical protein